MINIDDYIKKVEKKENVSDGGSPAYSFDNLILVKYTMPVKYGLARENEELIAVEANKKNKSGVNTPAHLAIKRVNDGETNICWVVQERAKGVSFAKYSTSNNEPQTQLCLQQELLNAPDYHYEKCISDIAELLHMGLELKPKNVFYDNSKDGVGFTFIDLLDYNPTPMNPNLISDVMWLDKYAQFICNSTYISSYNKKATETEKNKSLEFYYGIRKRIFMSMEKVVPNFKQFRRWVLRTYSDDVLEFFKKNGVDVGDLSLNELEYAQFNNYIEIIVNQCLEQISTGKKLFWQIEANEIRIMLDAMGLINAWNFHAANPIKNPKDFEDDWEFKSAQKKSLENLVNDLFNERLSKIAENSDNQYIIQAKNYLDERSGKRTQ